MRILRFSILALPLWGALACASAPRFAGMTADDLYELGRREFEEEDWEEASEVLDHLLLRVADPSFEHAPEARFMLARAYFNRGDYITAQGEYVRFVDRFPGHELAPQAALGMCQCFAEMSPIPERDQTYTEQAVQVCRNVVLDYSGFDDEVAQEAQAILNEMRSKLGEKVYLNGRHYLDRDFYDSAIIYFEDVFEDYGDTEWAPKAIMGMIEAYGEVGYDQEVEQWRQTLLNSYPDSPEARAVSNGPRADTSFAGG